ncbi:MAG: hypothetical protein HOP17_02130 [Acidobacteria bacterium]|nr:hypothetical protein [Acidobacteriota bacterium]
MVTACLRSGRTPGLIELRDLAGGSRIAELADTVFTLGRSHAGDDLRYLKHLKSRTGNRSLTHENTPVLQLSMLPEPPSSGVSMHKGKRTVENSALTKPFLGMTFLGPSAERDHFPTPEKPVRTGRRHKDAELLEFVLTGKYARYLER